LYHSTALHSLLNVVEVLFRISLKYSSLNPIFIQLKVFNFTSLYSHCVIQMCQMKADWGILDVWRVREWEILCLHNLYSSKMKNQRMKDFYGRMKQWQKLCEMLWTLTSTRSWFFLSCFVLILFSFSNLSKEIINLENFLLALAVHFIWNLWNVNVDVDVDVI
jgi:hypothetical protein